MAAEFFIFRTWTHLLMKWTTVVIAVVLVLIIFFATITPIPFSTQMDGKIASINQYINTNTTSQDSILVTGMKKYTAHQVLSWYLDRPQHICQSQNEFVEEWNKRNFDIGIITESNQSTMFEILIPQTDLIMGNFQIVLRNGNK